MHNFFKKGMAVTLSVLMTAAMMPFTAIPAYAADNERVLDGIDATGHISSIDINAFDIELTLDYGYTGSINLNTLDYDWGNDYSVTPSAIDFSPSTIEIDQTAIMEVPYSYASGGDTNEYTTLYEISAIEGEKPSFSGTISKSTTPDTDIAFTSSVFSDSTKYVVNDGEPLGSISIGAGSNTSVGTLKLGGSAYSSGTEISSANISSLVFDPLATGTVTYPVTAYANDSGKTNCGTATLSITVSSPTAAVITYTTNEDEKITLNDTHFKSVCSSTVGGTFDYLKFTSLPISNNQGKLYLGYDSASSYDELVNKTSRYDDADLDNITFVPYSGYDGNFTIGYTAINTDDEEYSGTVKFVVTAATTDASAIKYTTDEDVPVAFDGKDFADACDDANNEDLDYVKFTLPSSSKGILYVNYKSASSTGTKVIATTKYEEDDIDDITFVPKSGVSGSVTIAYKGYDTDGESFTGNVVVTVTADDSDIDAILYSTAQGVPKDFDSEDFVDNYDDATKDDLDYVKFTLPSSSYGTLYLNYKSSSDTGTKVTATAKYDENDIDDITFVPKSSYTGVVTIAYKAYNSDDESSTGKVRITVGASTGTTAIAYTTNEDTAVTLKDSDFDKISNSATSEDLDYVKFTLPNSSVGKLYFNYSSSSSSSLVSASTKYYMDDTPALSKVTFVPSKDFNGVVTFNYTGYNVEGDDFDGSVKITVVAVADTGASAYFGDVLEDYSWASPSIDALYKAGIVTGTSSSKYSPASKITRGDFMLMLYRGLDLKGSTTGNFGDVPSGSYYYTAIAVAKSLGIAKGSDGSFSPSTPITREDAMVLVSRALKADGKSLAIGSTGDLVSYVDRGSVSDYAISSVGALIKAGVIKGSGGYLNPQAPVTRAEMAVILYRVTQL